MSVVNKNASMSKNNITSYVTAVTADNTSGAEEVYVAAAIAKNWSMMFCGSAVVRARNLIGKVIIC